MRSPTAQPYQGKPVATKAKKKNSQVSRMVLITEDENGATHQLRSRSLLKILTSTSCAVRIDGDLDQNIGCNDHDSHRKNGQPEGL